MNKLCPSVSVQFPMPRQAPQQITDGDGESAGVGSGDAAAGSARPHTNAGAWNGSQQLYEDGNMDATSKLAMMAPCVRKFLEQETQNLLHSKRPLDVSCHTTFGRIKAQLLRLCTCDHDQSDEGKESCQIHCSSPCLNDLVYAVATELFAKFDDEFMCFANLFLETQTKGLQVKVAKIGWVRVGLSFQVSVGYFSE